MTGRITQAVLQVVQRVVRRRRIATGRLRWSIKISAPDDPSGDVWGDLAFADSLAAALRGQGQTVHVDRFATRRRPRQRYADDVTVVLRGIRRMEPVAGTISYLWVISHPDLVETEELKAAWQRVYAASAPWARSRSIDLSMRVAPLLQATDPALFHPAGERNHHDVLFVGTTRAVRRPVILDAIDAGADVAVYGHGWQEFVDPKHIADEFLPFPLVPAAYRGARIILNDHWEDMRKNGFLSNRLFDAAASGGRVISDRIDGLELFGGLVRTYSSAQELRNLLFSNDGWPSQNERISVARQIAAEHSFDQRAMTLISAAIDDLTSRARTPRKILEGFVLRRRR